MLTLLMNSFFQEHILYKLFVYFCNNQQIISIHIFSRDEMIFKLFIIDAKNTSVASTTFSGNPFEIYIRSNFIQKCLQFKSEYD